MVDWKNQDVIITGGASFIGSTLADALVRRGTRRIVVLDNISSGKEENLPLPKTTSVELVKCDLLKEYWPFNSNFDCVDPIVFHLAADHGGRGYVETQNRACATNLILDGNVFRACSDFWKARKVVFASSGCVYPNYIQQNTSELLYLSEDKVGPPYDSDNMYGWAKLMGEKTLQAYHKDSGLKSVSLRYFTVYGPRGKEDHAVMAMIARAVSHQDPFDIWGDGTQIRNWTFIEDIVEGTILAAESDVEDGTAINLGTMERIRVIDAASEAASLVGYSPRFRFKLDMPVGPLNRVADNELASRLLGWRPSVQFQEGLVRTLKWYSSSKTQKEITDALSNSLLSR